MSGACTFPQSSATQLPREHIVPGKRTRLTKESDDASAPEHVRLDVVKAHLGRALLALGETTAGTLAITNNYIRYDEVEDLLPSVETCTEIFEYFQTEIFWHCTYIHRPTLLSNWRRFAINGVSLPRTQIALFCLVIAMSLVQMPEAKIKSLSSDSLISLNHRAYVQLAQAISSDGSGVFRVTEHDDENLFIAGMMVNYFTAVGAPELTWEVLGKALRMARMVELFDNWKWSRTLTPLQTELRNRLAWELVFQDAFCCMHFTKEVDMREDTNMSYPKFYTDESYDFSNGLLLENPIENKINSAFFQGRHQLYEGVKRSTHFIRFYDRPHPAWLFQEAWNIDEEMDGIETFRFPTILRETTLKGTTREDYIRCHLSLLGLMGARRVRLSVFRMLLLNGNADGQVEEAALASARKIIEMLPTLDQLADSPYVAYFSPFCSSMLFHAACTFALSHLLRAGKTKLYPESDEHLKWLRENISTVINALSKASEKDIMAKRCAQLLTSICEESPELSKCFNGKLVNNLRQSGSKKQEKGRDAMIPIDIRKIVYESNGGPKVMPKDAANIGGMASNGVGGDTMMNQQDWNNLLTLLESDLDRFMHRH